MLYTAGARSYVSQRSAEDAADRACDLHAEFLSILYQSAWRHRGTPPDYQRPEVGVLYAKIYAFAKKLAKREYFLF